LLFLWMRVYGSRLPYYCPLRVAKFELKTAY
jgi:hypothetical protein